jgi:hypothetical protein
LEGFPMIALMIAAAALAADPPLPRGLQGPPPVVQRSTPTVPQLLPVYGVSADERGVTVQLAPAGCNSTKGDFTVAISKSAERPTVLIARRRATTAPLACKDQPGTILLAWSYADLGLMPGQPFSLANPLVKAP